MPELYIIQIQKNKEDPVSIPFSENEAFLGKGEDTLFKLKCWKIGKRQIQLYKKDDGIWLKDGGGISQITINNKPVYEYGPLTENDIIKLSSYSFRVITNKDNSLENNISEANIINNNEPDILKDYEIRGLLHKKLISAMDLRRINVSEMGDEELRSSVKKLITDLINSNKEFNYSDNFKEQLTNIVLNEVVGLGPLEVLLADEKISEVMVNGFDNIFIEKSGQLQKTEITFSNNTSVLAAIERIVSPLGRRIDEASPMVDARLKDGSRVNAIIPPLAIYGPSITIRKFSKKKLSGNDLIGFGTLNNQMLEFLELAVQQRANVVISGGTGSGKTTLLNILSLFIPDEERIVTVEDAAELQLTQPNLVALEARPANVEGRGAITIRDLVKNCLRMRPDRIVVGECRGGEALDMLQAMNTGHDGSLTTAHANTPRDCLSRLEVMTLMSGLDIPISAIREQVSSAVDIIVQQTRFACGSRRVTYITEVIGIENGHIKLANIFEFKQNGFDNNGKIKGEFQATGHIPEFCKNLIKRGIDVNTNLFKIGINHE